MATSGSGDLEAAQALVNVIGDSKWIVVAFARGYLALSIGQSESHAARIVYEAGGATLRKARDVLAVMANNGFLAHLPARERTGSAENPVTKLFPATITEQRFLELLDEITATRKTVGYSDEREAGHGLSDFTIRERRDELPINVKNAGTRFERARQLVGLEPDDCIPIPAYKAHAAVETHPNLLYVVSADYDLVGKLGELLPKVLTNHERLVWDLLNRCGGAHLRNGEDSFIFQTVRKYWDTIRPVAAANPFFVISARKALRILHIKPQRTPGIGLRAWGTGASAEVNVHVSINEEMTPWTNVRDRIVAHGVEDIVRAVNRKRVEEVYDPEI
jgi:hypothetical protein